MQLKDNKSFLLEESLKIAATSIENLPFAGWFSDASYNCLYCNQKWMALTGQTHHESTGQGYLTKIEDQVTFKRFVELSNLREDLRTEIKIANNKGIYKKYQFSVSPFFIDGKKIGYQNFVLPISEVTSKKEEKFKSLLDYTSDGVFITDDRGLFLEMNKKGQQMLGYSFEQLLLRPFKDIILPEDLELIPLNIHEITVGNSTIKDRRLVHSSGKIVYAEIIATRMTDGNIFAIMRDISDRKITEKLLKDSEKKYRTVIEETGQLIYDYEIASGTIKWSGAIEKITGFSEFEFEQTDIHKWEELIHPIDREKATAVLEETMKKDDLYLVEYRFRKKDFSFIWIEDRGVFLKDLQGNVVRMIGIMKDITDRKQYENALLISEERFRIAAESASDLIYEWNIKTGAMQWFGNIDQALGYQPNEFPRTIEGWNSIVAEEDKLNVEKQTAEHFAKNTPSYLEYSVRRKDGKLITWIDRGRTIRDEYGKATKWIGVITDITEKKKQEAELQNLADQLVRTNNELERFAYITSHNLRAPVVNLLSLIGFFNKTDINDPQNIFVLEKIEQSSHRLNTTLNDLLEILSVRNVTKEKKSWTYFDEIVESVKAGIENVIRDNNVTIHTDLEVDKIFYPSGHIHSILQNLLTNAIKYKSKDRAPEITIKTKLSGSYIELSVQDNGKGIDLNAFKEKIFGLYQRFDEEIEGKGLGLYIIKTQVEALDGKVDVKSEVGKGTIFTVFLNRELKNS